MKYLLPTCIACALLIGCGSDNKIKTIPQSAFDEVLTQAEIERIENSAGAVSIAIYHQGKVIFSGATGKTKVDSNVKATKNTLFQIGSTTKVLTNLAVLKQIEAKQYAMDTKLIELLPFINYPSENKEDWEHIQVNELMTHQGAFSDSYEGAQFNHHLVDYMMYDFPIHNQLMNKPGEFFNYSNPNFSYLGAVIAQQAGVDYPTFMKNEVFIPLGMARTTFEQDDVFNDGDYALGYHITENGLQKVDTIHQLDNHAAIMPAGNYTWSTPTEMLNVAKFIMQGDEGILSDKNQQLITQKHVNVPHAQDVHYGLGLFIESGLTYNNQWYPMTHYHHGGNTFSHTSSFHIFPEHDLAISILSSGYADNFDDTLFKAIETVIALPQAQKIPIKPINKQDFPLFAGTYTTDGIIIYVTMQNEQLTLSVPALDAQGISYSKTLQALGGNSFKVLLDGEDFYFNFILSDEGKPATYFANRNVVATRTDESMPTSQSILPISQWLKKAKMTQARIN